MRAKIVDIMREFKFRAWDEKLESWISDTEYSVFKGKPVMVFEQRDGNQFTLVMNNVNGNVYFCEDIKLQSFIEEIDKNGKEIYEGDIVRVERSKEFYDTPIISEVKWHQFYLCGEPERKGWSIKDENGHVYYLGTHPSGTEIIGNIFENPELLSEPDRGDVPTER